MTMPSTTSSCMDMSRPAYITDCVKIIANQDFPSIPPQFIKAFNIATAHDLEQTKDYEGMVDYFLFDTKGPSVGGNGVQFDWECAH